MSAPTKNVNAQTHGMHSFLTLGRCPKGCGYIHRLILRFRRGLEDEIVARHGIVGVYHAALIQSATRHEGRAQLLTRYLRVEQALALSNRISLLAGIGNATDSRDRCMKSMGLDATMAGGDPWGALDTPSRPPEPRAEEAATSEPVGAHGEQGGDDAAS